MVKQHARFLKSLLFLLDLVAICLCWVAAYYLRFSGLIISVTTDVPPLLSYLLLLVPIVMVWGIAFQVFRLYRPRRVSSQLVEFADIAMANTLSVLILIALMFFVKESDYSRTVILYFWLLNLLVLGFSRMIFRGGLRAARSLGYNLRHILIVGTGGGAIRTAHKLVEHPEMGFKIRGFLSSDRTDVGRTLHGAPVVGTFADLEERVASGVDIVFVCLTVGEAPAGEAILAYLMTTMVEVKVVPPVSEFMTLRAQAEMYEGLPVITLQGAPLLGWDLIVKRGLDLVGAVAVLVILAPLMALIAAAIKLSSPGPVLYWQRRMGLDGVVFDMLKFRSMHMDAEAKTGPVWTQAGDSRCTAIGRFLRRTSLDELPQFWNVLMGDMSIVGPRPERPEFIEQFRRKFPRYMLRHKIKAGITGWAQINGWRGNTSLEKRLEFDLYYLEHWSVVFDLKIILRTLWSGFVHRHAY